MLRSGILAGNARLERAAVGPPSIKRRPPDDDADAVQRLQRALREIGYALPMSFKSGAPDGKFGDETLRAVRDFQRHVFADDPSQWDGHVGPHTLAKLDEALVGDNRIVEGLAVDRIHSVETVKLGRGLA